MNQFLTKYVWAVSKDTESIIPLSFSGKQYRLLCTFNNHCPLLYLWVGIKAPTGLCYTITGSISRGSNSSFNDDVNDKTSDLFTHKENNFHFKGWGNWWVSSLILNIFPKMKNQIWYKVRLHARKNFIQDRGDFKKSIDTSFIHEFLLSLVCF